jgi:hypothetical protein
MQPDAIEGHACAIAAVRGKSKTTEVEGLTPAGWVLYLARRELPGLIEILESANKELDAALTAYEKAKQ